MKRAIALLLTLLTLCAALPAGSFAAPSDGETRAALPASATLVGSAALPPVPNQGGVGSCASEAIAYRQFTNAVGRYMNAVAPDVDWNPASGKKEQIFSPKYTYTLSGSGTAWVYNVLVDHGCLPTSVSSFWKSADGGSQYKKDGVLVKSAVKWDVENDLMQTALSYRLKNYEQIWVNRAPYVSTETPKVNGFDNVQITTSEAGRTLITKIKDALLRGNAVVTGGYISRWLTGHLTGDGEIGKAGDPAIIASAGNAAGGHQVTIVGYDDKIECKVGNSTMKGGFLVANSWGPDWGKDGCEWLMYDALNTVSEFEEYNKEGFYSGDMFIDALNDTTVVMNPSYSATGDQTVTFTKAGTVRVSGENYTTYNLYSEALGGYLAYSTSSSDRSLRIEKTAGKNTAWAFIPYETMSKWGTSNKEFVDESYNGSYWIYAAGRTSAGATGYAYLDAGLGYTSSGRSVGIASHNSIRYPEAKSWYAVIDESKDSFRSPLGIWAGRGKSLARCWTMDQFCFTYWDEDITLEKPELYVKMDITTDNREGLYFLMTRQPKDSTGSSGRRTKQPAVSQYYNYHPTYDIEGGWSTEGNKMTFSGTQNGAAETATVYLSYSSLLYDIPEGTTLSDYKWGIRLGARRKTDVTFSNVQLLSQDGKVLQTLTFDENGAKSLTVEGSKNSTMSTVKYSSYFTFGTLPEESYKATVKAGEGLTVTPVTDGELRYGDSYSFKVETAPGYAPRYLTVSKNGVPLLGKDGVYTTTVCGDLEITAVGAVPYADMNGDRKATIADVTALIAYLTDGEKLPEDATPDLTGDGKVTAKDLTRLLMFLENDQTVLSAGVNP